MLEKVKAIQDGITIAGDGRHDSMGHCAKYGAYTIFFAALFPYSGKVILNKYMDNDLLPHQSLHSLNNKGNS